MQKWYVYIIECSDKTLYCGITKDISRRIAMHDSGRGAKYTKGNGPVGLLYSEEYLTHEAAAKREAQIKGWSREKKLNLIKYGKLAK